MYQELNLFDESSQPSFNPVLNGPMLKMYFTHADKEAYDEDFIIQ
jgi:hypothetical protein